MIAFRRALSSIQGRRFFGLSLGLVVCGVLHAATARAAQPNIDNTPGKETPGAVAIEQLHLSDALADYGEQNADPWALAEAAKIRKMLPPPLNDASSTGSLRTYESLLARATQLSSANPAMAAFIADVRRLKARSISVIPLDIKLLHKQVEQNGEDRAEVRFLAGEIAIVYVRPVPPVNLDLYVYDDLNNLICAGGAAEHESECRWRPRHDGSFLIDVHNNTSTQVDYELAINRDLVPR